MDSECCKLSNLIGEVKHSNGGKKEITLICKICGDSKINKLEEWIGYKLDKFERLIEDVK